MQKKQLTNRKKYCMLSLYFKVILLLFGGKYNEKESFICFNGFRYGFCNDSLRFQRTDNRYDN